jgi:hypothetical protein
MAYHRRKRQVTGGSMFKPTGTKFWWVRWCYQQRKFQIATGVTTKKQARVWLISPHVAAVIDKILAPIHRGRWGKRH